MEAWTRQDEQPAARARWMYLVLQTSDDGRACKPSRKLLGLSIVTAAAI